VRRGASVFVVAVGVVLLLGSYILYTQRVVSELRREAERSGRMYARVYEALASPAEDAPGVFLELARQIRESRVPVLLTDPEGDITAAANTPFDGRVDDPRARTDPKVREYIAKLDRQNPPLTERGIGTLHIGDTPLVNGLRIIPLVQAGTLALFCLPASTRFAPVSGRIAKRFGPEWRESRRTSSEPRCRRSVDGSSSSVNARAIH